MTKILNDTKNIYLANCLYDCIEDNNIHAVKKLLHEHGANANIIIPDKGITPFHFAIGSGGETTAEKITKLFIAYGGNPNVRSVEKVTPVHIAAAWGRLKVLNILLQCGGDPTLTDEEGKTPLDYAKTENYSYIIDSIENFLQDLNPDTQVDILEYDLMLHKVINNSEIIAEYGLFNQDLTKIDKFDINTQPANVIKNWSNEHEKNRKFTQNKNENTISTINENNRKSTENKNDNTISTNNENNKNIQINSINKTVDKNLNITINSEEDNNLNKDIYVVHISSEDSTGYKQYSRESGILTLADTSFENILDKCVINNTENNSTAEYLTCESINSFEKNITNSLITLDLSNQPTNNDILNITSDKSIEILTKDDSLISVEEEYKYIDNDEGIVLIEKRILVNPKSDDNKSANSGSSKFSMDYDTDTLRHELTSRGEPPGPITNTTKRIYVIKLKKLQKYTLFETPVKKNENNRVYSVELEKTLRNPDWATDLTSYRGLESVIVNQFSKPEPSKRWREGVTKTSFTYLLLDPRITLNLPVKSTELSQEEIWKTFLSAIFYVGKGKRSRPYSHLYEAVNFWKKGETLHKDNKKLNYILDIWQNNFGVVCLHIFQNVIPVEAYTREAAMINALKLQNLCNSKLGDFYGLCATWPERKKRLLGVYLLYRAMLIFLNEGERQLMPDDIGK